MMEINYRRIKPKESLLYRAMRLDSLMHYPDSFLSTYADQKSKPKLAFEKFIEQATSYKFVMGAFLGKKLIGICGFYQHQEEGRRRGGEIIQMYVQPAYQKKGIAKALTEATIHEIFLLPEIEQIGLGVLTGNLAARRLYVRLGFEVYRRPEYYDKIDGEYMVLFRKCSLKTKL